MASGSCDAAVMSLLLSPPEDVPSDMIGCVSLLLSPADVSPNETLVSASLLLSPSAPSVPLSDSRCNEADDVATSPGSIHTMCGRDLVNSSNCKVAQLNSL